MTKSNEVDIKYVRELVDECVKNDKLDFLSNIIHNLQRNYTELAELSTNGNYNSGWSHQKVLDFVTFELS